MGEIQHQILHQGTALPWHRSESHILWAGVSHGHVLKHGTCGWQWAKGFTESQSHSR